VAAVQSGIFFADSVVVGDGAKFARMHALVVVPRLNEICGVHVAVAVAVVVAVAVAVVKAFQNVIQFFL
jgi:hypothetical protein